MRRIPESNTAPPLQAEAVKLRTRVGRCVPQTPKTQLCSPGGIPGKPTRGDPDPLLPTAPLPGRPHKPPSPAPPPTRRHSPTWLLLRGSAGAASTPGWLQPSTSLVHLYFCLREPLGVDQQVIEDRLLLALR